MRKRTAAPFSKTAVGIPLLTHILAYIAWSVPGRLESRCHRHQMNLNIQAADWQLEVSPLSAAERAGG